MSEIRPLLGGSTSSTVSGKNVALNQINSMQRLREQPEFSDMSEDEVCSVELFQIFARYVTETATTSKDQNEMLLMRDTCTQYVSGVKILAFARFPKTKNLDDRAALVHEAQELNCCSCQQKADTSWWIGTRKIWGRRLYSIDVNYEEHDEGETFKLMEPSVTKILIFICSLWQTGTAKSTCRSFALVMLFCAV